MKSKLIFLAFGLVLSVVLLIAPDPGAYAAVQRPPWHIWVKQLRTEAIEKGIRPEVFDTAFKNIKAPNRRVLNYDRSQPEKRLTYLKYRNTRADAYRIRMGRKKYRQNRQLLNEISRQYGVSPCFIVSLWGLETSYGNYMGNFPVIKSLATLAYDKRRGSFFRKQLFYALHILNDGHVKNKDFKGEWAGASGQPQFLPSSFHHYAVDHNGDGRKDIWKTKSDVFASIANYLIKHGWKTGQPWALTIKLPAGFDKSLVNSKTTKPIGEWRQMGLRTYKGRPWPTDDQYDATLVRPYGGPDMLIFNNFKVIMKWNRSIYYAGTVGWMAEQVCGRSL